VCRCGGGGGQGRWMKGVQKGGVQWRVRAVCSFQQHAMPSVNERLVQTDKTQVWYCMLRGCSVCLPAAGRGGPINRPECLAVAAVPGAVQRPTRPRQVKV